MEQRLEAVECKLAFVEDLVEQLNAVVSSQQRQIDALERQLTQLQERIRQGETPLARPEEEAPPPHY